MVVEWWWENCSKLVWSSYQRVRLTYTFQLIDSKFLKFISWSSWTSGLQRFQHVLFMVSGVFYYFNSILNPILYTILSRFMINYLSSLAVIPTSHVQWSTLISFLNFSRRFRRGFSDIYKKCWINHQVKGQFHIRPEVNLMKSQLESGGKTLRFEVALPSASCIFGRVLSSFWGKNLSQSPVHAHCPMHLAGSKEISATSVRKFYNLILFYPKTLLIQYHQ